MTWLERVKDKEWVLPDTNDLVTARIESPKDHCYLAFIDGVLHGDFISQIGAKTYIDKYIKESG